MDNRVEKVRCNAETIMHKAKKVTLDMFVKLPNELVLHIISFLTPKEFIATRCLSKKWLSLSPVIHINGQSISEIQEYLQCLTTQGVETRSVSINLQDFAWKYEIEPLFSSFAEKVYELCFCCPNYRISETFLSNSLAVLRLVDCRLDNLPNNMSWRLDSLRVLSLIQVSFSADNLDHLISVSPNISHLTLEEIGPLRLLDLSPLTRLKDVKISGTYYCEEIAMEAPNLRSVVFFSDCTTKCKVVLRGCRKLEKLILRTETPPLLCMEEIFSECPLLEFVHMLSSESSPPIFISPYCAKGVSICLKRAVNTPDTYLLEYSRSYKPFVFVVKSEPQGKVMFRAEHDVCISTSCFEYLRTLVQKARNISVLSFRFIWEIIIKQDVNLGELRSYASPVRHMKQVKLDFTRTRGPFPLKSCGNLIDAFLCCCFPGTLTVKFGRFQSDFVEDLCEKLMARGKGWNTCCEATDFKCWRHFLEDVEIKRGTTTNKQGRSFKKFDIRFQWSEATSMSSSGT